MEFEISAGFPKGSCRLWGYAIVYNVVGPYFSFTDFRCDYENTNYIIICGDKLNTFNIFDYQL